MPLEIKKVGVWRQSFIVSGTGQALLKLVTASKVTFASKGVKSDSK
jgi:hypothetical protein